MRAAFQRLLCSFILFFTVPMAEATDPPAGKRPTEFATPIATYRAYIEAVRRNDLSAAKRCWTIDDDNRSGVLDAVVGFWVSMRQFNQIAEKKFGAQGLDALKNWRRNDLTGPALDLTEKRLGGADVQIRGDVAEVTIRWKEGDGGETPAFEFCRDPIYFRKTNTGWKIDAHKMAGVTHGATFFESSTGGRMLRDQVAIAQQGIDRMEKGELKSAKELGAFLNERGKALEEKYTEEMKKEAPKSK